MSETLRDLVVSLSLNSDNFTRNIKSVNKHIQQAESEFKLAAAGVQGFEKSAAGLSAKLGTLGQKLNLQKVAVDQYQKALTQAEQKLTECKARQQDYAQRLVEARAKQAELGAEVDRASAKYEAFKGMLGETDNAVMEDKAHLDDLKEQYAAASAEVKKLEGQQTALKKSTQTASDAVAQASTNLNTARAALKETQAEIDRCNKSLTTAQSVWTKAGTAIETFGNKLSKEGKAIASAGKSLTTTITTPIAALGAASIKASIDFESSFAGVRKTVDATEEEYAKLADASKKMSTQIATSTNEINGVMATGGQLGIYNNYLASFTRTMIDLGNSCEDLNANDAATQLAKFANIMHTDQSLFQNMGSTVVALGNNFATTERPIVEMAMRLAGAGKQVGLTEAQVLGFATALSSVGIEAQMGGSAFSKALIKMEVAAQTGGEALEDFATVSGMTEDAFKQLFETDPAAAFQSFIVGLSKMDDEGESAIVTLNDIGISEIRLRDTLLRATNATELFSRAQETATRAWAENTALTEEASKRYATTESKLKNLKNTAILFGQQIGDDLNPTIQKLTDGATDLLNRFMGMDEAQRMQIIRFAGVAAAAGPMLTAYGKVAGGIGKASTAIGKFMTTVGKAGGGFKGLMSVVKSSPSFWFAVAVAVGAGTAALIDYASGAKQAREAMEGMQKTADTWKNTAAETFYGSSQGLSFFGLSKEDFVQSGKEATATSQQWLEGLLEVWSDGKSETNAIVSQWTDSWKALSAGTREGMAELQKSADASGNTSLSAQLQADLDTLDSLDEELAALLKKRQSKLFTDGDKVRLQELIDTREALEVKYSLTPATDGAEGFDDIRQKLQAEVARAQALGKEDADASVYENATVAAAQGLAAVNDQIDAQYDKEFALIQLMEDGAEKDAARAALDKKYSADRNAAAKEYASFMAEVTPKVYAQEDIQKAKSDLKELRDFFDPAKNGGANLTDNETKAAFAKLTEGMDEGALTEYLALLTQIHELTQSGMTDAEVQALFPEMNVTEALTSYAEVAEKLKEYKTLLPGLHDMFLEAVPEEVREIAVGLNLDKAGEDWNNFANAPHDIHTGATIDGYAEAPGITLPTPSSTLSLTGYETDTLRAFMKVNPIEVDGSLRVGNLTSDPGKLVEQDGVYVWKDGARIDVTPKVVGQIRPSDLVVLEEDGTMHVLITPKVQGTPEAVDAASKKLNEETRKTFEGLLNGGLGSTLDIRLNNLLPNLKAYQEIQGTWWKDWPVLNNQGQMGTALQNAIDDNDLAAMQQFVAESLTLMESGQKLTDKQMEQLQSIAELMSLLDATNLDETTEAGVKIKAALDAALRGAGLEEEGKSIAQTLLDAIQAGLTESDLSPALDDALESLEKPGGNGVAVPTDLGEGVGKNFREGVESELGDNALYAAGLGAMRGLGLGVLAGSSYVASIVRRAVQTSVTGAAKSALKINSPSRVFRDEVGRMAMKGLGVGYLEESKRQAAIIRNASRYLTGEAKSGAIVSNQNDNRRTYNQNSSVNLTVQNLQVRDEQDVRSLAVEIASLTRQQQRGRGQRMA